MISLIPDFYKSSRTVKVYLGLLILFHIIGFLAFQYIDKSFQTWDSAGHIGMSYNIFGNFKALLRGQINYIQFLQTSDYYPPFVQSLGAVLASIFGYHSDILLLISLAFYILSIIFIYMDVELITRRRGLAFLSAFVFSFLPQVFEQSRVFHLDLPLIALLLASLYFFIKSKALINTKYSIIFAILFSLVQLTKWYGFIYLIVPCLYITCVYWKDLLQNKTKFIRNLILSAFLVAVIAVPWYVANYQKIEEYSTIFSSGEIDDPQFFWSLDNFLYYPARILSHQLFLIPTIFTIIGGIFLAISKRKYFWLVFLSIILPILVFTLIGNKNLRYVFPLTPIFAFLISYAVSYASKFSKVAKYVMLTVLVASLLFTYFFASFNTVKPHNPILKPIGIMFSGPYWTLWDYDPGLYAAHVYKWPTDEIWDFIAEDSKDEQFVFGVTPLIDKRYFSLATFELIRRENNFNKAFVPVPYFQFEPFKSDKEILEYLDENDVKYVLVSSDVGPEGLRNSEVLKQMRDYFLSDRNTQYEFVKAYELPDGYPLRVFRRTGMGQSVRNDLALNCKSDAGLDDGIETIKLNKNYTYIFYTGHFGVNDIIGEYEPGQLYILQVENVVHESMLDVYNLPHVGAGMCEYDYVDVDVQEAIDRALTEKNNCGTDCEKVIRYKWVVGDDDFEREEYTRSNITPIVEEGSGIN